MNLTSQQVAALTAGIKGTLDHLELQLDTKAFQEALPVVGNELHGAYTAGAAPTKHLSNLKTKIAQVLEGQYAAGGDSVAIQNSINSALSAEGLGSVQFSTPAGSTVQMAISSNKTYAQAVATNVEGDLGLPGVGLAVQGQGASTQLGYQLALNVGLQGANSFYVDAASDNLKVQVDARATGNNTSQATLGGASYSADFRPSATGADTRLQGDITLGIAGTGKISLATLKGGSTVGTTFTGSAEIHADLTANGAPDQKPDLHSQLDVSWQFNQTKLNGSAANDLTFGNRPTVSFQEVQASLSNFVAQGLEPVFGPLSSGLGSLAQVVSALNTTLPVLGDLGLPNTLAEFIEAFATDAAGFGAAVSALDEALSFISSVSSAGLVDWIDLGTLTLGATQDIRAKNFSLSGLNLGNATINRAGTSSDLSNFLGNAAGITMPVFDSSTNDGFAYLLGGSARFLEANLPELSANITGFSQFFPIIGPLGVALQGDLGITANIDFGMDTGGFYLSDHRVGGRDLPEFSLTASLLAAAELNLGLVRGGVGGGLFASVLLDLRDPNADGRVTFTELQQNIAFGRLFNVAGQVDIGLQAYLKLGIGPFSKTFSKNLGSLTLLDFTRGEDTVNAQPAVLAAVQKDKTLLVHVGKFSELRDYGVLTDAGYTSNEFSTEREFELVLSGSPDQWFISKSPTGINVFRGSNQPGDLNTNQEYKGMTNIHIVASDVDMPAISLAGRSGFATVTLPFFYEGGEGIDAVIGGDGVNTLRGGGGGDYLRGGKSKDVIRGDGGDDYLVGGAGNDLLYGGAGNDYFFNEAGVDVYSGEDGEDTLEYGTSVPVVFTVKLTPGKTGTLGTARQGTETDSFFSIERLIGGSGNDIFNGSPLNDIFHGGAGNDLMYGGEGDDYFNGGPGADTINGGGPLVTNPGKDTISYKGSPTGVSVNLFNGEVSGGWATGDVISNIQNVEGSDFNDTLTAGNGPSAIYGGAGNDFIFADTLSTGADLLVGGEGSDYILADALDTVSWADSRGGVSVNLPNGSASNHGESTGNANGDTFTNVQRVILSNYADVFLGNAFDNWVNPGLGRESVFGQDSLDGGGGTDTLYVDYSVGDNVDGLSGTFSSTTPNGLLLRRTLNGSAFDQVLYKNFEQLEFRGGRQNDAVKGLIGNDVLIGNGGNDSLYGAGGSDYLEGGEGDDYLEVKFTGFEPSLTVSIIKGGPGFDEVLIDILDTVSGVNFGPAFLDAGIYQVHYSEIEKMRVFGGSGNDVFNLGNYHSIIFAGGGDDLIIGGSGDDDFEGSDGNDDLRGGAGNDRLNGEGDNDRLDGGAGNDEIYGGHGNDTIIGSSGYDTVNGGDGIDTLVFDGTNFTKPIFMAPGYFSTGSATLAIRSTQYADVEQIYLQGTKFADLIHGASGDDQLAGLAGNDKMYGNEGNDFLNGNTGNDTLDGGTGADIMYGREGNDHFYVDHTGDVVMEFPKEGTDTVHSSLPSYTLPANVENLILASGAISGTGNSGKNIIIGNNQANIFEGGGGGDIFQGLNGRDTYYVRVIGDIVQERANQGIDKVIAAINYTLPANVEDLMLIESAIKGTGNALANIIVGNTNNNTLDGGAGDDVIAGGDVLGGDPDDPWHGLGERDIFIGGAGRDTFVLGRDGLRFYDDYEAGSGFGDFVLLKDFDPRFDKLALGSPTSEFSLRGVYYNTISKTANFPFGVEKINARGLFHDSDGSGGYSAGDELIAVLPNKIFDLDSVAVPDPMLI